MIGDKIKERRLELKLTQLQLSQLTDIKKNTISNYENNVSSPSEENISKLMNALKCDANYLFEWSENGNINLSLTEKSYIKKYRTLDEHGKAMVDFALNEEYNRCTFIESEEEIPKFEITFSELPASAGIGEWLSDEHLSTIKIPDTPLNRKADIAIPISGNSMEPEFNDGDIVLIREQPSVNIGELGIFIINGSGYLKKFYGDRLVSLNPDYEDIILHEYDNIQCKGKVIGKVEQ